MANFESSISSAQLRELMSYDADTGIFTWINPTAHIVKKGDISNCINSSGYIVIGIKRKRLRAHRLAWLYVTGDWPEYSIDHINGIKSDNRFSNLRCVDHATNMQNRRSANSGGSCDLLGVTKRAGKFRSQIKIDKKTYSLGSFNSEIEAHAKYLKVKRLLHNGCTI